MPEISKIKLTSGDEYNIKDTTAREMISSHTHTNESMGFGYGTCDTAASTTAKTVSISNYKLSTDGGIVSIKFDYDVLANATLNINSTGAKPIYYNGAAITDNIIKAVDTATFIYDGTNYNLISLDRDFNPITVDTALSTTSTNPVENNVITNALNNKADSTHTHTNESMGFGYGHTNYDYFCGIVDDYALTDGNIILCEFTNDVPAGATLNINNTGDKPIYYNGSPITYGIIKAGDTAILKYNENLDLSFSRFDFIGLYHFYELDADNSNSQEEINIDAPIDEIEIINGQNFNIRFDYDVPANATLNINDTGAKPIYYNGSPIKNNVIKANDNVIFIYNINDGRYDLLATNNYNNENVNHYYYGSALICYGITLDGYTQTKGGIVSIKFYDDVEPNATLNINSTGAKSIYHNGFIRSDIIKAGDIATFIYDGTRYNLISLDRDFNIINESMGFGYGTCITAASTTAKTVSMYGYELTKGGMVSIKFYDDVLSGATLNINNTGAKPIYHDGEGLSSLNSIIKAGDTATFIYDGNGYYLIARGNITNENMGFGYGTCTRAASIIDKTVSIIDYKLTKGGIVSIKFAYNVPADATLNINNTGARDIYYNGSAITDYIIKAEDTATFIYDGTNYNLISLDRDFNPITVDSSLSTTSTNPVQNSVITNALNNHTHTNESMGFGYGTCITAASTTAKTVSMYRINYKLTKGGIVSIKFAYNVPADATLNINSTGARDIYYNGSAITANIIKAEDTATFIYDGTRYNLISLDRDFNPITVDSSLSTTSNNPVQNSVITNALNNKADNTHTHTNESMGFGYAINFDSQANKDRRVFISGYELTNGGIVSIKFNYAVPEDATLNISSTGAKPIVHNGGLIKDGIIKKGDTATFIYDGASSSYILIATNNFTNASIGFGYGTCSTAASTAAKTVSIFDYKLTKDGIVSIKFTYAVSASSTLNIYYTGDKPIYYNGSAITDGIIKAGDTATFIYDGTRYNLISLDRDFNPITVDSSLSTTSNNPVQNSVITNALNNYIPTIVGTQIESTNNWTGNAQFETLEDGQRILYYLPYDNSSGSDVVLNLTLADGTTQTGNINCYLSGSTRLNSQYEAGNFIPLIYKENIAFNGSSTTYTGWWAYTDKDIDSKVQNTLNNTTKAYITGTTNNTTNIGTQIFDNNVYLGTTAGELNTKSLKLNEKVTLNYNTNNNCIDFTFS